MNNEFVNKLNGIFSPREILRDEPMSSHTTFRVGGPADIYVKPTTEQLRQLMDLAKATDTPLTIIGNGSNLLVSDDGIRGVVAEIGPGLEQVIVGTNMVVAQAGARLSKVAKAAYDASLTGFEFAAGIPGTVGGAVFMNAGAYGGEIKDIIVSANVLKADGSVVCMTKDQLDLSYRHSALVESGDIVLSATFKLEEGDKEQIAATMADLRERRQDKQPLDFPSAGSTFKRPEGYFAGKLIEDAGLKGYTVGGAQVSKKHSGFVINKGGASAADIVKLIEDVQEKVLADFGVKLETEVKYLGF